MTTPDLTPIYRSPADGSALTREGDHWVDSNGHHFGARDGVPDLTWPLELEQEDAETRALYDEIAADYHKYAPLPFRTYRCSEHDVREDITDRLRLTPGMRVLDVGCGTGDGTTHIARRLEDDGEVHAQDLSPGLLALARRALAESNVPVYFSLGNACSLSFSDDAFDAAHHFGGLNTFSDIPGFLAEMARVVRPGGRVVIGDEGLGPWLKDTEFGRIMSNSNPLLKFAPPLEHLPVTASNVAVEWIMMGAFWLIEFTVAAGSPEADYQVRIPSARGGTHWTRYHGNLEGVSDEAKSLAHKARAHAGESMHDWLERVVRAEAAREFGEDE